MKKFFVGFASVFAVASCAAFSAGCNVKHYNFCTNISPDNYVVLARNYSAAEYNGGIVNGGFFNSVDGAENADKFTAMQKTNYVMGTWANLVVSDDFTSEEKVAAFNSLDGEIFELLMQVENSVSVMKQSSCIIDFNNAEAGAKVKIDKTSYTLLQIALDMYEFTEGYYNPAVYYSVYDYGFHGLFGYMTEQNMPSDETLEKYVRLSSHFGEIILSEEEDGYYATKPDYTEEVNGQAISLKIDLGGIGKGYVTDVVNGLMDKYGFAYGNFNFGASSMAIKKHYQGGRYSLGLTDPRARDGGSVYFCVSVADTCLSTSGDYEQYYEIGGVRYCHIINPFTGKPVQTGIMTATVIGGSAAENDALTTAIMCMGREKAEEFIKTKLSAKNAVFSFEDTDGGKVQ